MTGHANSTPRSPRRRGGDSYNNLEPWFEKLRALGPTDPDRAALRERIIERCLPLAEHIAARYEGRGIEFEDLYQVACVGLLGAVDRFDPDRGPNFLAFAVPTIMGEVRRHFRDQGWAMRVPRGVKETHLRIGPVIEALSQRLARTPRPSEIAAELGIDRGEVTQALVAANAYRTDSLDAPLSTNDDEADPVGPAALLGSDEPGYELLDDAMAVRPLLQALPDSDRQVLIWRYAENMSQAQIAKRLGCSQMHISRTLSRILTTVREQALTTDSPHPHTRAA
ncbi:RNA polymerase sigma factor SigF [Nocardia takedensis]|uniref:RNA polymerase sigma factor SigF n=1 Tax=Nocardia takedensis TaxID=259390 RepID=UPI0002E9E9E0|nr:RNA polymerase sigma factor SigF [Nocardia takedensis]